MKQKIIDNSKEKNKVIKPLLREDFPENNKKGYAIDKDWDRFLIDVWINNNSYDFQNQTGGFICDLSSECFLSKPTQNKGFKLEKNTPEDVLKHIKQQNLNIGHEKLQKILTYKTIDRVLQTHDPLKVFFNENRIKMIKGRRDALIKKTWADVEAARAQYKEENPANAS